MEIANQLYCPNKVCLGLETQQVCIQVIQMHFNQVVPLMTFSDITKIHSVYSGQNWLQRQNNESLSANFSYNNYYTQGTFGVLVLMPIIFYLIPINSTVWYTTEFIPFTKTAIYFQQYIFILLSICFMQNFSLKFKIFSYLSVNGLLFLEMCKGCLWKIIQMFSWQELYNKIYCNQETL